MSDDYDDDDEDLDDDVAEIVILSERRKPKKPETPVVVPTAITADCSHRQHGVTLDPETRSATCRRCGAVVDLYDALLDIGKRWKHWIGQVEFARHEVESLTKDIEALKRVRDNVRRTRDGGIDILQVDPEILKRYTDDQAKDLGQAFLNRLRWNKRPILVTFKKEEAKRGAEEK